MEKQIWHSAFVLCSALTLVGCSSDSFAPSDGTGTVELQLDVDRQVLTATPSRASLPEIVEGLTADDFTIRLVASNGQSQQWSYADFSGEKIAAGTYTLEAFYGTEGEEGFEKPYFAGSTQVVVRSDESTHAAVTTSLKNAAVTVSYSDTFKSYMTAYSASIRTAGSADGLDYPSSATDDLFVNAGEASLYVTFTTPQNQTATLKVVDFTAEAQHRYNISVDLNNGNMGDAVLTITFDDTAQVAEPIEIVLSEELLNAPAPAISATATTVNIVKGDKGNGRFDIIAHGGLKSVKLISSGSALPAGWPAEAELVGGCAAIPSLGLRGLSEAGSTAAVVDLADAISTLGAGTATFTLEAVDAYGKVSEADVTPSITVNTEPVDISINGQQVLAAGADRVTLSVGYNGSDINNVRFSYKARSGEWKDAEIISATPASRATANYNVTLKVEATYSNVEVKARAGAAEASFTAERQTPDFTAVAPENDVFAKHAVVRLSSINDEVAADLATSARWAVSTDNGNSWTNVSATVSGTSARLEGLTPGTAYRVRATVSDKQATAALTTEAALQIPNSDMETWSRTDGQTKYWWIEYPGASKADAIWATVNELTTSEGGSGTNMFDHKGCSYCAFSGTRKTTDVHGGSLAAVIETVGYGDNDANGTTTVGKGCKKIAAGELFLGSYDNGANYSGYAFASRPSSIEFWYKYRQKNSADYGYAEFRILNSDNKDITEAKTIQLPKADTYQKVTIPLNYLRLTNGKAAKIMVSFKSSGNQECLKINTDNLDCPSFGNTSDGRFTGSSLYIDDITLNY